MICSLDIWSLGHKKGAQSLYETIKGLQRPGYKIWYLTDRSGKKVKHNNVLLKGIICKIFNLNIDITVLNNKLLKSVLNKIRWILFQFYVLFYGMSIIKREKIDLIYAYEIYGIFSAFILKLFFHKPLITRFQGTILEPKLKNRLNLFLYLEHTLAFFLSRYSDLIIMANDGTQGDKVLKYFKVPQKKIRFWYNGVDVNIKDIKGINSINIRNRKLSLKGVHVLVTLSRLAVWKRVDRIIQALPAIIKVYNRKKIYLIIIGDGEDRGKLEKLCCDLNISEYVFFTGALSHDKALEILKRADLFISLYDLSNVGNPLLEAMKLKRCIVTLNNGSTGQIIKNNKNGILLELVNLKKRLPGIILDLLSDKNKRNKMGDQAFYFAQNELNTWEQRMTREVQEIEKIRF